MQGSDLNHGNEAKSPVSIVAVVGSYRKGGIIDQAVDHVLAAASEHGASTRKIYLLDKRIEFCTNCRCCTQTTGLLPGHCVHQDDMQEMLTELEDAQVVILASPMNFGQVTALMKRFIERMLPYAYWPWGKMIPSVRRKGKHHKAVLVTSSTMPAFVGRIMTGIFGTLREAANVMGARVAGRLYIGSVGLSSDQQLPEAAIRRARRIGTRIARG